MLLDSELKGDNDLALKFRSFLLHPVTEGSLVAADGLPFYDLHLAQYLAYGRSLENVCLLALNDKRLQSSNRKNERLMNHRKWMLGLLQ